MTTTAVQFHTVAECADCDGGPGLVGIGLPHRDSVGGVAAAEELDHVPLTYHPFLPKHAYKHLLQ